MASYILARVLPMQVFLPELTHWWALANRFWPTFYVVDKNGSIRDVVVGETHEGDRNALRIESKIQALLLDD